MKYRRVAYHGYNEEKIVFVPGFTYHCGFAGTSYDAYIKYNKKSKKLDMFSADDMSKIAEYKSIDQFMRELDFFYFIYLMENVDIVNGKLIEKDPY